MGAGYIPDGIDPPAPLCVHCLFPEQAPMCFRCGLGGHKAAKCPGRNEMSTCGRAGRRNATRASRGRCWVCDAAGHHAAQCPQARAGYMSCDGWKLRSPANLSWRPRTTLGV